MSAALKLNPALASGPAVGQTSTSSNALDLIARLLIVVLFLSAGLGKVTGFEQTVGYIGSVGLPLPALGAALAAVVEIVGSIALLLGFRTRIAAIVLAAFTLVASLFFHAFWSVPADQAMVQQLLFFKNIAIVGGLLGLAGSAGGQWRLDARR